MAAQGQRLEWVDVDESVRAGLEKLLGSPVVEAVNQLGGFSPGVAARCVLADGRRCFIKAVSSAQNPIAPKFHRREGNVAAALPRGLPVPELLARYDDGDWVALVFEDVEGTPPSLPWTMDALAATVDALRRLADATTPCPVPGLLSIGEHLGRELHGFRTLAEDDDAASALDPALRARLNELAELESRWAAAAAGKSLLHSDLRADNLLVREDGSIVIVDWPHAAVGAPWVDLVLMLPSVGLDGGPSPEVVADALDPFAGVPDEALDAVLAAMTGYFVHQSTLPDPPGIPTVRAFQRAQGEVAATWLLHRLDRR